MVLSKTVTTIVSGQSADVSGETTLGNCSELSLNEAVQVEIEAVVTYNASATSGAVVRIWAAAVMGTYGDEPIDEFALPFTAGTTVRHSFQTLASPRYIKATVRNLDESHPVTAISVMATVQSVS